MMAPERAFGDGLENRVIWKKADLCSMAAQNLVMRLPAEKWENMSLVNWMTELRKFEGSVESVARLLLVVCSKMQARNNC